MSGGHGDDPEETMPFTHRTYGSGEPENPFTSPSGAAGQPSGPGYVPPPAPPPPMASPPGAAWGAAWTPAYGPPVAGGQDHKGAQNAMVLGVVALVCLGLSLFCCVTIPGVFVAPFAWVVGARAKRDIDAAPGVYRNRGAAQAGVVMGIIGTVCGLVVLAAFVGIAVLVGSGWSLV